MGEEEEAGDDNIPMTLLMLIDNFYLQRYINNQFYKKYRLVLVSELYVI